MPWLVVIDILKPDEIDVQEIVEFTIEAEKQLDEQLRCGRTQKEVEDFVRGAFQVSYCYVLARENKILVGLARLYVLSESMVYLDSWHPLILPGADHDELFRHLVKECISHTRAIDRSRLEVFLMNLTDDIRSTYDRYRPLYESAGMRRGNEWSQMICDLTTSELIEPDLPVGFSLRPIVEVSNDEIWPCYNETFLSSSDRRYLDQTEAQRRENFDDFFSRSKPIEEDASLLLYFGERIVGFHKIDIISEGGFVNGVGIHPEFRRRGLGRLLMTASLVRAARNKMMNVILEVDIENHRAIALYEHLGFKKRRGSISHIWTAG
jgi:ribosomal protein S18 acetylase RimI-like enzyme